MTTEEILNKLREKDIEVVVILKANEGYSVIPMAKEIYTTYFLMQKHWNDKTINTALNKLLNKEA